MKHFIAQLISCLLLLTLIFSAVALLSRYQRRQINELQALCDDLPLSLDRDESIIEKVSALEEQLKKAGMSLAFFTHYEQLNAAYLAASSLRSAVTTGAEEQYGRALCELKEALGTLERNESFSLEVII